MKDQEKIIKAEVKDYQILNQKYQRALADYQNLLKQKDKELKDWLVYANANLISELLPVYEHLKLSLAHSQKSNDWLDGVKHTLKQFKQVLQARGVVEISTIGQSFDPQIMEAVEERLTADQTQDGLVAQELTGGYLLQQRVLIPAKVAVYKFNPPKADQPLTENLKGNN